MAKGFSASQVICRLDRLRVQGSRFEVWTQCQPYALGTRTLSCFGHGCSANRMLLEHARYHALAMGAVPTVCSRNTNVIMLWAWMLCQPYALGTRTLSCFGHGCSANRMLLEHERYHALGMGAVPTVCSRNTNVIMLWAWMLCQPYALGTRTLSCFGHGCSANRRLLEHERYHALAMGAVPTVCSRNTNVIMLWAWMLCQPYALGTGTLSWERYHGCHMDALWEWIEFVGTRSGLPHGCSVGMDED